jgi:hypothetical protein
MFGVDSLELDLVCHLYQQDPTCRASKSSVYPQSHAGMWPPNKCGACF